MSLPIFRAQDDPGPNFTALVSKENFLGQFQGNFAGFSKDEIRHATTVLAMRTKNGVLMAGDRRATEANRIAHRAMEKVYQADRHSAIAIAGAAGPAMEMVRIYQIQLDHFEKVEGVALSLEGKANQLGQMVAGHLALAMQGLAVVPLFAGFDLKREVGRIFSYDVTGGRYEEADFAATGSGGRDARSVVKMGFKEGLEDLEAIKLALSALKEAADEDSATGGIDLSRKIYPIVAVVTSDGYQRIEDDVLASMTSEIDAGAPR
ncbi:MAG: proteasome subunit beta [Acidimicrobiales bacterium]|nr:proteasome subunit beta [Acidimicrobiales bacterium]